MNVTDLALRWAARGVHVFPLGEAKMPLGNCTACKDAHHDKATCPCPAQGRPCHGFYAATTDEALIKLLFDHPRARNVGIACGKSGLVVVDCDVYKEGETKAPTWMERSDGTVFTSDLIPGERVTTSREKVERIVHGVDVYRAVLEHKGVEHVDTFTVTTPSGGVHFVYHAEDAEALPNSIRAFHLIDLKTGGGYVVAAGSATAKGTYEAIDRSWPPAPAPAWILDKLRQKRAVRDSYSLRRNTLAATDELAVRDPERYCAAVLRNLVKEVADAQLGMVYDTVRRVTYKAAPFVNGGALDEEEVVEALEEAVESIPCPERVRDVRRCLRDALSRRHAIHVVTLDFGGEDDEDMEGFEIEPDALAPKPAPEAVPVEERSEPPGFDLADLYQRVLRQVSEAEDQRSATVRGVAALAPLVDSKALDPGLLVRHLTCVTQGLTEGEVRSLASEGFHKWKNLP